MLLTNTPKNKCLSGVFKIKTKIAPVTILGEKYPDWLNLEPKESQDFKFNQLKLNSQIYRMLFPSVRIQYTRYRYRIYDYRITLDTNIEAFSPDNGLPREISHALLPHHVLEIKTYATRPTLPFIGIIKLPQISFF